MSATPQDVLMEAARILMRDGWTQGVYSARTGERCVIGAVEQAMRELRLGVDVDPLESLLRRFLGTDCVELWNDAPERTAEDVILALKRAASESS